MRKKKNDVTVDMITESEAKALNKGTVKWVAIDSIKPYEKNPRDNSESIPKVAESIREFGFLQPIVCDSDGVILAGHTRYAASQSLGLKEVPVLFAKGLTEAQAKAYRLADNKVSESSRWDDGFLMEELNDLAVFDFDMADFGFDMSEVGRRRKSWAATEKKCNLKKKIKQHSHGGLIYTTFYESGKEGKPLEEIKEDEGNVELFADNLCDYLEEVAGMNLSKGGWCMCTTPRRRHKSGFHFATEICRVTAKKMGIPFYADAFEAENRSRIDPVFNMKNEPKEQNVILYDDIVTTGMTLKTIRQLLIDSGHVVLMAVGIKN